VRGNSPLQAGAAVRGEDGVCVQQLAVLALPCVKQARHAQRRLALQVHEEWLLARVLLRAPQQALAPRVRGSAAHAGRD